MLTVIIFVYGIKHENFFSFLKKISRVSTKGIYISLQLVKVIRLKRDSNDLKRKTVFKELKIVFNITCLNKSNSYSYSSHS